MGCGAGDARRGNRLRLGITKDKGDQVNAGKRLMVASPMSDGRKAKREGAVGFDIHRCRGIEAVGVMT